MRKLGLDIHGVIDAEPEIYINMALLFDEVHIITGGSFTNTKYNLEQELYEFGVNFFLKYPHLQNKEDSAKWWTHQFSIYDHLEEIGAKTNEELGIASHHPFPDETWNKVKGVYCRDNNIDLHVDDMPQYMEFFTTPYLLHKDPNRNHRGQFGTQLK